MNKLKSIYNKPLPDPLKDTDLSPCPECGALYNIPFQRLGPTRLMYTDRQFRVICLSCWHKGKFARTLQGAVDNWNNRVNNSKLKEYRLKAGLSQAKLAEMCDIGSSTISCYEIGQSTPSQERKEKIAKGLGVNVEML